MHNKNESLRLLYESVQAAIKLTHCIEDYGYHGADDYKARQTCVRLWQRHWRRVTSFNEQFGENLYIPEWYNE